MHDARRNCNGLGASLRFFRVAQAKKGRPTMIRPTVPADTEALVKIAQGTNVFKPHEIMALGEVLADYHSTNHAQGHQAVTFEKDGKILGFAYFAPAAMADRTWYLYWIAVGKQTQAKGVGTQLLHYSEKKIKEADGRVYFIETSSLPMYEQTRKFYLKHGYKQDAELKDYYADGDSMVIFRKHLKNP
jgi:ribosomal protein S18 acetylase RimI-like enzyme